MRTRRVTARVGVELEFRLGLALALGLGLVAVVLFRTTVTLILRILCGAKLDQSRVPENRTSPHITSYWA